MRGHLVGRGGPVRYEYELRVLGAAILQALGDALEGDRRALDWAVDVLDESPQDVLRLARHYVPGGRRAKLKPEILAFQELLESADLLSVDEVMRRCQVGRQMAIALINRHLDAGDLQVVQTGGPRRLAWYRPARNVDEGRKTNDRRA